MSANITRLNPDVGDLDPSILEGVNVSQIVRAGDMFYFSGLVAAKGNMETVAPGDYRGQLEFVLAALGRLLESQGLTFANLVATTTYTTDVAQLSANVDVWKKAFAGHPPTSTWVEVKALASPDYMLELVAVASL